MENELLDFSGDEDKNVWVIMGLTMYALHLSPSY